MNGPTDRGRSLSRRHWPGMYTRYMVGQHALPSWLARSQRHISGLNLVVYLQSKLALQSACCGFGRIVTVFGVVMTRIRQRALD